MKRKCAIPRSGWRLAATSRAGATSMQCECARDKYMTIPSWQPLALTKNTKSTDLALSLPCLVKPSFQAHLCSSPPLLTLPFTNTRPRHRSLKTSWAAVDRSHWRPQKRAYRTPLAHKPPTSRRPRKPQLRPLKKSPRPSDRPQGPGYPMIGSTRTTRETTLYELHSFSMPWILSGPDY